MYEIDFSIIKKEVKYHIKQCDSFTIAILGSSQYKSYLACTITSIIRENKEEKDLNIKYSFTKETFSENIKESEKGSILIHYLHDFSNENISMLNSIIPILRPYSIFLIFLVSSNIHLDKKIEDPQLPTLKKYIPNLNDKVFSLLSLDLLFNIKEFKENRLRTEIFNKWNVGITALNELFVCNIPINKEHINKCLKKYKKFRKTSVKTIMKKEE